MKDRVNYCRQHKRALCAIKTVSDDKMAGERKEGLEIEKGERENDTETKQEACLHTAFIGLVDVVRRKMCISL
jgi:hypothetical protein